MIAIVKNNLNTITDLCKKYHVRSLYLFGSAARVSDFTDKSDIDFLVSFESLPTITNEDIFYKVENYDHLQRNLELAINRKIDLLQETNIKNKYLKYFINKEKKLLYGIS